MKFVLKGARKLAPGLLHVIDEPESAALIAYLDRKGTYATSRLSLVEVPRTVRARDAIHLATAIRIAPDEVITYDRRLLRAAAAHGLAVASPGA